MDKSKMMMGIIIALLLLLIGTVVGVGLYLMSQVPGEAPSIKPLPEDVISIKDMRIVQLGEKITNLAPGPGGRLDFISCEITVGLDERKPGEEFEEFYAEFNKNIPLALGIADNVLIQRTFEEMRTLEGKQETAEIIKNALQQAFESNLIVDVTFNKYTVDRR
jgi:flagellar basal body-associated protein FliL